MTTTVCVLAPPAAGETVSTVAEVAFVVWKPTLALSFVHVIVPVDLVALTNILASATELTSICTLEVAGVDTLYVYAWDSALIKISFNTVV